METLKRTEIGSIPTSWNVRTIGDIATVQGGKRLPLGKSLTDTVTKHPYIRVTDMRPGGVSTRALKYVPNDVFPTIKNYTVSVDDIFISVAGTLGIAGKIPAFLDGANLTENADKITNISCDRDFLLHNLLSERIQKQIEAERTVGAQPKLALNRIEKMFVALPPLLSEQKAISGALNDIDELIDLLQSSVYKRRDLRQATMQQLLTGKTRLSPFSGDWRTNRIGEVLKIMHGKSQRGVEDRNGAFPILATGGQIGTANRFLYDKPSVLIGRKGTIDQPQYMDCRRERFWFAVVRFCR